MGSEPVDRLAWLAVAMVPGIGPRRMQALLEAFGSPAAILAAPHGARAAVPGISTACATALGMARRDDAARLLARTESLGGVVLLPDDDHYPAALRQIPDPPLALFGLGQLGLLQRPAVAIVGTRELSAYGRVVAHEVATVAARAGLVVVSGMARGVDATAHEAALATGTIGVLGNGLGVVYPAANAQLYERVAREGLLLTEYPPGDKPNAGSFPRRNRLVSGLAGATVVIEAGETSGALITARTALEQGRDVLAVPGPITTRTSLGTNRLIRLGATPYLEPADLLGAYPALPDRDAALRGARYAPVPPHATARQQAVARALGVEPVGIEALLGSVDATVSELLADLAQLEVAGVVEQRPGRGFVRVLARA